MTRDVWRTAARLAIVAFCWMTALYSCIASSTFAYLQFIKPRVFPWLGAFSDWHSALSWLWLLILVAYLRPHTGGGRREAAAARMLLGFAVLLVGAATFTSAVARLADGPASVVAGVLAATPVLWLALVDHANAARYLACQRGASTEAEYELHEGRLFVATAAAAALLTAAYAILASVSIAGAFEPDLLTGGLATGVLSSLLEHTLIYCAVFAVGAAVMRVGSVSVRRQYALLMCLLGALFAAGFARLVGDSIGLNGWTSRIVALIFGASIALTWGGMRLTSWAKRNSAVTNAFDLLLFPPDDARPSRLVAPLVAVLPLAWTFAWLASRMDWDFAVLKCGVVLVWVLTFALVYRAAPLRHVPTWLVAGPFALAILIHALWHPTAAQQHARDRYAVHNPSFLVADTLVRVAPKTRSFDRYLRANTNLTDEAIPAVSIDFARPLAPARSAPPNIFLFVIDSLRADYLEPYNHAVRFTPHLARFADENLVLPNAFTRYGGTGLSMPAIWAGSVLVHKQYVVPFDPMNALQKLVDTNGYRRIETHDHITKALWSGLDRDVELERGRTEMQFDFCRTVDELGTRLEAGKDDRRPVFAQTRSLNLHVAEVRNGYVPPDRSYPGFEAPYAYRVERIDGCFGAFIDRLKQLGLYDRSIVVLTADHGELIGEDGRWGHSYHLFPQVIQVPLFMHLPPAVAGQPIDRNAVALSTDITPTLYAALGYQVSPRDGLAGHSLFDAVGAIDRRRNPVVLSASYGAVYAVLSRNGRRLYIADAIREQEYAYERQSLDDFHWSPADVTPGRRLLEQLRIRRHIDTVARTYGLDQTF